MSRHQLLDHPDDVQGAPAPAVTLGAVRAAFGRHRRAGLVLLAVAVGLVALPATSSATGSWCRWQTAAHELFLSLDGRTDERSTELIQALDRAGAGSAQADTCATPTATKPAPTSAPGATGGPSTATSAAPASPNSAAVPAPAAAAPAAAPANRITDIIDLTNWYITLPTGSKGHPDTVEMPQLAGYSSPWFHLDDTRHGVVFTANAGGETTSGSSYPRSELREMDGSKKAAWSNTSGTHTLSVRQAVTAQPTAKPDVVTAQIHDSASDVIEVRLEGTRLIASYNDGHTDATLDPHYVLGTAYDLTMVASGGRIRVTYNGATKLDIPKKGSGWYFKSGSYVQSNTSKGDKASAVGVVVIYRLDVTHTR